MCTHMCLHVLVCICVCVYMCVCLYMLMHLCMSTGLSLDMCVFAHVGMFVCITMYLCVCMCVFICAYVFIVVYACLFVYSSISTFSSCDWFHCFFFATLLDICNYCSSWVHFITLNRVTEVTLAIIPEISINRKYNWPRSPDAVLKSKIHFLQLPQTSDNKQQWQ